MNILDAKVMGISSCWMDVGGWRQSNRMKRLLELLSSSLWHNMIE